MSLRWNIGDRVKVNPTRGGTRYFDGRIGTIVDVQLKHAWPFIVALDGGLKDIPFAADELQPEPKAQP